MLEIIIFGAFTGVGCFVLWYLLQDPDLQREPCVIKYPVLWLLYIIIQYTLSILLMDEYVLFIIVFSPVIVFYLDNLQK